MHLIQSYTTHVQRTFSCPNPNRISEKISPNNSISDCMRPQLNRISDAALANKNLVN